MRWGRRASTRTATEAAAAMQASVGQIVKSLVFKGKTTGKPHLILVSGSIASTSRRWRRCS
jgi:prolyl-tRNA editing enzyme YbaK/EbsC (Cys-tRNA(Pro) deacylase)